MLIEDLFHSHTFVQATQNQPVDGQRWVVASLPDLPNDPVEPSDLASFAPELATSIGLAFAM